jgi:cell division protein FtsB
MDNITISHFENDAVQDKKLESYEWGKNNFLAGQELTVTITLGEYRELVSSNATAKQQIDAKIQKVIALEQDLKKLKEEAERLKAENYDLQNKVLAVREQDQREGETADADRKDG